MTERDCLKVGTDKPKLKVKMLPASDDDAWKTSWKATFWAGGERSHQTGKMLHYWCINLCIPRFFSKWEPHYSYCTQSKRVSC